MQTDVGCQTQTASCSGRDHAALHLQPQQRRAPRHHSRCRAFLMLCRKCTKGLQSELTGRCKCRKSRRRQVVCQVQSITGQITPPSPKLAKNSRVAVNHPEPAQQDELRNSSGSGNGQIAEERVGVLLLNLGGPETLKDVQPFLFNLFRDPDIIRLPSGIKWIQPTLAWIISSLRAPKSMEGYRSIGGGSPLRRITNEQAEAIAAQLEARGQPANVYVAMRYWKPFTEDAMEQVKLDKVTRLVILPLYPQFSISTSGSSLRLIQEIFETDEGLKDLKHTVIPSWYQRPGYVTAMADLIQQQLTKFPRSDSVQLFFSAHGVPLSYVEEAGDPYREEMQECVGLIIRELLRRGVQNPHTLAYQSRVGPVEWLRPYTDETIRNLGASGVKSMLAVPISFVSEHIETLEEIDVEYRELAESVGIEHWGRVPALNTNEVFIEDLSSAILEALPSANKMSPASFDSLVPSGDVSTLLDTYDRDRRALPQPMLQWNWGWTASAETWNGRLAMLAIFVILLLEVATGQGALGRWLSLT